MDVRIRGLLFDLWNTLLASDAPVNPVLELGRRLREAGASGWLPAIEKGMMMRPLGGIDEALPEVERAAGIVLEPQARREAARAWQRASEKVALFSDVLPALDRLRDRYRLGLLSNTQSFDLEFLRSSGLEERFHSVRYSWQTALLKPDPRAFAEATAALELQPHEVLMVGDNWRDDVSGARAAGLRAVFIRRRGGALSHRERPRDEPFIDDLHDLERLLAAGKPL